MHQSIFNSEVDNFTEGILPIYFRGMIGLVKFIYYWVFYFFHIAVSNVLRIKSWWCLLLLLLIFYFVELRLSVSLLIDKCFSVLLMLLWTNFPLLKIS